MTEKLREQISALADDELSHSEHELLLRRFAVEKYLGLCWERYHLIGEAMRKGLPAVDTRGFADRVMRAIGPAQAPPAQPPRKLSSRAGRAAAGVAVAACVAVVAILGLRYENLHPQPATGPAVIVPPPSPLPSVFRPYGKVTDAAWNGTSPEVRAELGNYVISHAETSAALGQQNMLPYFFITNFDTRETPHPHPSQRPASPHQ